MVIKSIDFYISDKQHIAGTMTCEYEGKDYNFGPGQLGTVDRCLDFLDHKKDYVGLTIKTSGFAGHVGRAAKIGEFHLDK
jgi:hypothetical protein